MACQNPQIGTNLAELTQEAMRILSKNREGFILLVEGSQIDWAAHDQDHEEIIAEMIDFDGAVGTGLDFAQKHGNTLILVTADHETGGLTLKSDDFGDLKTKWTTGGHTDTQVPIFAYGPGAEQFAGTLDNTDIPKRLAELTGIETFPLPSKLELTAVQLSKD